MIWVNLWGVGSVWCQGYGGVCVLVSLTDVKVGGVGEVEV